MAAALPTNPMAWTVVQVELWCSKEKLFADLASAFAENEMDGPALLSLDANDLKSEFHIKALGVRKNMLLRIAELAKPSESQNQHAAGGSIACTGDSASVGAGASKPAGVST